MTPQVTPKSLSAPKQSDEEIARIAARNISVFDGENWRYQVILAALQKVRSQVAPTPSEVKPDLGEKEAASGKTVETQIDRSRFRVKGVEVKPCPFCCVTPELMDVGDGGKALMIECVTEGCVNPSVSFYNREWAVKLWNWRKPFTKEAK